MLINYLWRISLALGLIHSSIAISDQLEWHYEDVIEVTGDSDSWDEVYSTERACVQTSHAPRYPVVLLHGFMGFDEVLRIDYFYRVRSDYTRNCAQVFTPHLSALNYISVRAEELAANIDEILEITGAEKVNIIAHSMGGLDARYLISSMGYGDRVASLTTIGTPHLGTPVPDYIWALLGKGDNILYQAFEFLVGGVVGKGKEQDLQAALYNLSPTYLNSFFNPANRDDNRVYYQSYAGMSSMTGVTTGDALDPLLYLFAPSFIGTGRNDGLVPLESAKWGRFRGILRSDHIDLIGQLFGSTSWFFNHRKFYKNILDDLAAMGF
ncbi:MAG: lipase family alpha/beta hydrolase [Oligoflexus sp.]